MRINPKQLEKMAKKLGMQTNEIEAEEVVITTKDKRIIIKNPQVSKINMMGQESFQISGDVVEKPKEEFTEEDIRTVIDQTGAPEEEVRDVLMHTHGDLVETIMKLKKKSKG